jgi:hypothetical protein
MKVLFLDIDGVLNPFRTDYDGEIVTRLDDKCVQNLRHVVEETGCKIVISSTWKVSSHLMDMLDEELVPNLPNGSVIGCTPTILPQEKREKEISAYISEHSDDIEKYVVVDDYDFELSDFIKEGKCVITDALSGFTAENAEDCIGMLNS